MDLPGVLIYGLIAFLILLEIIVVFSFWAYYRLSQRHSEVLQEKREAQSHNEERVGRIIDGAEKQAEEILRDATSKAEEIIKRSQFITDELSQKLTQDLQRLPQIQEDVYKQVFSGVEKDTKQLLSQVAEEMKQQAMDETKTFGAVLQKEALASQESVKQMIADAYKRAEKEIDEYKRQRMVKLDESIQRLVAEVSREVLGKVLTTQDHQELVKKALDKNKGVWGGKSEE